MTFLRQVSACAGSQMEQFTIDNPLETLGDTLRMLGRLPKQHRQVLSMHFGLLSGKPMRVVDIAKRLGVVPSRVSQVLTEAKERAKPILEHMLAEKRRRDVASH